VELHLHSPIRLHSVVLKAQGQLYLTLHILKLHSLLYCYLYGSDIHSSVTHIQMFLKTKIHCFDVGRTKYLRESLRNTFHLFVSSLVSSFVSHVTPIFNQFPLCPVSRYYIFTVRGSELIQYRVLKLCADRSPRNVKPFLTSLFYTKRQEVA